MARNVTIKDIAREAGVSIALVSFVMNNRVEANGKNKYRVSEDTKRRILEVAERMNYRPSSAARMLRQGRTHVVGVILSDLSNIFYGCIAKYMENIMYQNGYTVLFSSTEEDPERFGRLVQLSLARDVEGFIVVPPEGGETYVKQLQESGKPFVVIDRYHPDLDVPSVLVDNVGAIHTAIDCLRRQGAKNIAMASYSMRISSMMDRERGFREEMGEDAPIYHLGFNSVEQDAEKVVDDIIRRKIDGLIPVSNVPGVALIKALMRRGVRIQKDIHLVGFDFSNVYGLFDPAIPYIQQPLKEVSAKSAAYLFRLIEMQEKGEDIRPITDKIYLKASLI